MTTFKTRFHRYLNGQSRISAPHWINAEDFHAATKTAHMMVSAMRDVDLDSIFQIASIEADGLRGEECSTGWETMEEFSARIAEKA